MNKFTERQSYLRQILEENGVIPFIGEGRERASWMMCKYKETADRVAYVLWYAYVCENALKLNFVDLLFSKDKYNLLPWYKKLKLHIPSFNDGKYTSFTSKLKEYIQLFNSALERDIAVCVDIVTLCYMLDCGDRNMAYIYHYNREKDKQVYEI